jgi:hypothetical protein
VLSLSHIVRFISDSAPILSPAVHASNGFMAWSGALPNVDRLGSGAETQLSGVTLRCARKFEASRKHEGYVVVAASHGNGTAIMGTFTHQIGDRRGSDPPPSVRRLSRVSDLKTPTPFCKPGSGVCQPGPRPWLFLGGSGSKRPYVPPNPRQLSSLDQQHVPLRLHCPGVSHLTF